MTKAATELCMGCMSPLRDSAAACPHCGYYPGISPDPDYIEPGTVLGARYIIGRIVHKNGEGARYVGYDNATKTKVWIHEYFPHAIAGRGQEAGNILPYQGHGAQYKAQMSDFLDICNEIKRLSVTEPVVPIDNVLNENNTIYAIYQDISAIPLEDYLEKQGGKLPVDQALNLFLPLLGTLSNIHGHGQIHRGISPYTVYVDPAGKLYLWHFALAAIRTAGSELEAELFSGYSAPEQYSPSSWQGTWTDVYGAGALLYRILSGVVPPKSTLIGRERPLVPLEDMVMGLPRKISEAVTAAMELSSDRRTQAVATLAAQLSQTDSSNTTVYDAVQISKRPAQRTPPSRLDQPPDEGGQDKSGREGRSMSAKYVALAVGVTAVILLGLIVLFMYVFYPDLNPGGAAESSSQVSEVAPDLVEQTPDDNVVPRFVGKNINDVLSDAAYTDRFSFKSKPEYSDDWPEGTIYEQNPVEGTETGGKITVTLMVSKGPMLLKMPNVVGKPLDEALAILEAANISGDLIQTFSKYDPVAVPNSVVSTNLDEGTEFDPKLQKVVLFVASAESKEESSTISPPSVYSGDDDGPPPIIFHN